MKELIYLKIQFPKIGTTKIQKDIYVRPWIRKMMKNQKFNEEINDIEKAIKFNQVYTRFF